MVERYGSERALQYAQDYQSIESPISRPAVGAPSIPPLTADDFPPVDLSGIDDLGDLSINIAPETQQAKNDVAGLNEAHAAGGNSLSRQMTAAQRRDFLAANGASLQTAYFARNQSDAQSSLALQLDGARAGIEAYPAHEVAPLEAALDYLADSPRIGAGFQLAGASLGLAGVVLGVPETGGVDRPEFRSHSRAV